MTTRLLAISIMGIKVGVAQEVRAQRGERAGHDRDGIGAGLLAFLLPNNMVRFFIEVH